MNENINPSAENLGPAEKELEKVLRPKEFEDFKGQEAVVENLKVFVQSLRRGTQSGSVDPTKANARGPNAN